MNQEIQDYSSHFEQLSLKDAARLRRLQKSILERQSKGLPYDKKLKNLEDEVAACLDAQIQKVQNVPTIEFPEQLPISQKADDIVELIKAHQVVILAGETGSGKTTQLPKICLSIGRGLKGRIGHTQPRRIAARTVASRIAEELNTELGTAVGYQVRFNDHTTPQSYIKLMTDGILLAEIQHDPLLLAYDTLIIDEAHERSLNIDFLLGYLKRILPKRPDLKVIVTSATIDLERFSEHFNNAPIIEVSGRTYPVELEYRPWQENFDDINDCIVETVEDILTSSNDGDILIFMSGEREIREASHAIKKANLAHVEILPLYARLSLAEQNRVFQGHRGRRIVLATNVAETSITVPGIKYVIDPGYARISRYSLRTKVQRLPIEPISQASANQRKGRCGRVSNGVCYRLYSEEDFQGRPEFTDAEILRTNLAAVILQMLQMKVGDVRQFSFVDAPDKRLINDGFKLLEELRAATPSGKITHIGRALQKLPIDPRLGAVILEAQTKGCLKETLIIVSALSIQDPRERPADKQQASDEKHRRFADDTSDFVGYLNLWQYIEEQRQELSQSQLRKLCQREFINYLRVREWRDLHHQLKLAIKSLDFKENNQPASYDSLHKALLAGFVTQIGQKDIEKNSRDYFGTRQKKYQIFPGSSQAKKRHAWMVAAQYIETSQLFAHCVAKIEPEWVLEYAGHLVKKNYFEPHYDVKAGQVRAFMRTSLLGLILQEKKRVAYNKIDEQQASEIFVREVLVEGKYRGKGQFFKANRSLIEGIQTLEAKSRRRDILVDDQVIYEFYKSRVPVSISNLTGFESWRKKQEQKDPQLLFMKQSDLMLHEAGHISEQQYPDIITLGDYVVSATYCFEPGKENDGVNIQVPVEILHEIPEHLLEWTVPGVLRDKCIALVKSLPKNIRKNFVPVPDTVDKVLSRLRPSNRSLTEALGEGLGHLTSTSVPDDAWMGIQVDDFFLVNIQVIDDRGKVIDQSRNILSLRKKYRAQVQQTLSNVGDSIEKNNIVEWDFGRLEKSIELDKGPLKIKAYPVLEHSIDSVSLKVIDNPGEAAYRTQFGIAKLASLACHQTSKYLKKNLLRGKDLGLAVVNIGKKDGLIEDVILAAVNQAVIVGHDLPRDKAEFESHVNAGKSNIVEIAERYESILAESLKTVVSIKKRIKENKNPLLLAMAVGDIQKQIDNLYYPHFVLHVPLEWFEHYPRYLNAILIRLEKVAQNPNKDRAWAQTLDEFWQLHTERLEKEGRWAYEQNENWQMFRWMLEELRVSLFAQTLKTTMPVSEKRIRKQWEASLA